MVERVFATLYSWMRTMMAHMGLYYNPKTGLWTEFTETANTLENIMLNMYKEKCAFEKFYGKMPDYAKYSKTDK